jgi:hypothetical protein
VPSDVVRDWDGGYCVSWSKAKSLVDEITAATAAHERADRQRRETQMDDEQAGRMRPVRAYEGAVASTARRVAGVVVSAPGETEPGWMSAAGEDR